MAGSTFGNQFKIMTWGESHGAGVGVVIDGCPAGIPLAESDIQVMLNKRKPGQSKYTTPRKEDDEVEILSGIFEGKTTGTPISMVVRNKTQRSADYSEIARFYRPGHADYTFDEKYGFRAVKILATLGISICTYSKEIGGIAASYDNFDKEQIEKNPFRMPDEKAAAQVEEYAMKQIEQGDSIGGIIECVIDGMMPGIGEPVFDKLDAKLAQAVFSIGAVKGFEIGSGFNAARLTGTENNDAFYMNNGKVEKKTNNAGGILGGMSDGSQIVFRTAIKPTPSISSVQDTVNKDGEDIKVSIKGRHDPMIVPRAVVVVESMAALALVDLIFENMTSRIDNIVKFYKK